MSDAGDPCDICSGLSEHRAGCFRLKLPCVVCKGITHRDCSGKQKDRKQDFDSFDDLVFSLKKTLKLWDEGVINRLELGGWIIKSVDEFKEKMY